MADTAAPIVVGPITEADVEGFHAALDSVAREGRYLIFQTAPPVEAMRSFVRDNIGRGNPHMVARDAGNGGRVVGWCDIRRKEREAQAHCGVLGMGIVEGYRDRGLGRRLITAALDAARSAGLERVELDANAENLRAIALYEKVGFVHEGIARRAVRLQGRLIDSVRMGLILS